jgi:hypothetical protein
MENKNSSTSKITAPSLFLIGKNIVTLIFIFDYYLVRLLLIT